MKLIHLLIRHLAISLTLILGLWAWLFYLFLNQYLMERVDKNLKDYASEQISLYLSNADQFPLLKDEDETGTYPYSIIPLTDTLTGYQNVETYSHSLQTTRKKKGNDEYRNYYTVFYDRYSTPYLFRTWTRIDQEKNILDKAFLWIVLLYIGILTLTLTISYLVIEKNMQPLYRLISKLKSYQVQNDFNPDNFKQDISVKTREFLILYAAVENQLLKISQMYRQQKEFVDNAAHEMQTPLAVSMNRLEQMMQRPDLNEKQLGEIIHIHNTLRKLSRLQKDMLRLSRIENGAYQEKESIDIVSLAQESVSTLQEIFEHKKLDCKLTGNCILDMNPSLAQLLVHNLIRNAFVHAPFSSYIHIRMSPEGFSVSNPGEKALDREFIFKRFAQATQSEGTSGLGLSICQAICRQSGLSLDYFFISNHEGPLNRDVSYGGTHLFTVKKMNSDH